MSGSSNSKLKLYRPDQNIIYTEDQFRTDPNNIYVNGQQKENPEYPIKLLETKINVTLKIQKNLSPLFDVISTTLKNFADHTTMHGFREFYYSKSYVWKAIWLTAVFVAFGASGYQLYNTISYSMDKPTSTVIQPLLDTSQTEFPTLRICYIHWMIWIDWAKGIKAGFSKSSVLYGMSYLSPIVSETQLDVDLAKKDFENTMAKNGFIKLIQFYDALSPVYPPGVKVQYLQNTTNWTKTLDPAYWRLCYVLYNEDIKLVLSKMAEQAMNTKNAIELEYDNRYFKLNSDYMSFNEFEVYAGGFVTTFVKGYESPAIERINMSKVTVSPTINVDGVRTNVFMVAKEMFEARIRLTGTLYKWLNTDERKCIGEISDHFEYCDKYCYWTEISHYYKPKCIEVGGAELIGQHNMTNICRHAFFLPNDTVVLGDFPTDLYRRDAPWELDKSHDSYVSCMAKQCAPPCDHWKFISTLSAVPFPSELVDLGLPTLIDVEYPQNIIVFTEIASLTWETLIGNIGGICGLWMGASVISILQLVYLCCCSACDNKMSTFKNTLK